MYHILLGRKDLLNYFTVEMFITIPIQNSNKTGLFLYVQKHLKSIFFSHDLCYL